MSGAVDAAINAAYGSYRAGAMKKGRNDEWPFVPVIVSPGVSGRGKHVEQLRGLAFATREQAIDCAERHIAKLKAHMRKRLADPRCTALRRQWGLDAAECAA